MKRKYYFLTVVLCILTLALGNSSLAFAAAPTLKLSTTSVSVVVKKTSTIKIKTNTTGRKPTYKSSSTKIAKVSTSGVITGISKGTATITVTAGSKKATCKVTVLEPSLKLSKTSASVLEGKTVAIKVKTNTTGAKPTYKSSSTKIAKVSSKGVVTGVKKGTATITVTAGGKKATFKVTVKPSEILPEELELSEYEVLDQKRERDIHAIVSPSNAKNKNVSYISSDTSVVTVDNNGIITGISEGTAYITAKTVNGISAVCEVDVTNIVLGDLNEVYSEEKDTTLIVPIGEVKLNESVTTLTETLGMPDRIDKNEFGGQTYIYNDDLGSLVFVYVTDDKVVGYFTCATQFQCAGVSNNSNDVELSELLLYPVNDKPSLSKLLLNRIL